jgi:hypothetical protein
LGGLTGPVDNRRCIRIDRSRIVGAGDADVEAVRNAPAKALDQVGIGGRIGRQHASTDCALMVPPAGAETLCHVFSACIIFLYK